MSCRQSEPNKNRALFASIVISFEEADFGLVVVGQQLAREVQLGTTEA